MTFTPKTCERAGGNQTPGEHTCRGTLRWSCKDVHANSSQVCKSLVSLLHSFCLALVCWEGICFFSAFCLLFLHISSLCLLRKFHAARRDSHWPISKFPGVLPLSPALSSISQDYRQPVARKSHSPCFFGEQLVSRSLLYINCRYHISTTIQAFRTKPKQESSSIQLSHG